jgi:hypothetical protein
LTAVGTFSAALLTGGSSICAISERTESASKEGEDGSYAGDDENRLDEDDEEGRLPSPSWPRRQLIWERLLLINRPSRLTIRAM